ncbi:type IV secretory system conjugative DNA transfer family protein [Bradyrhizobium sp. DASA03005]|uniref:type IV secretory system conjugative DNA transfer family protein n=1 Tax=Bradyrhizobium sp. SPXBL-02 TaxID=3395912 RepID=UPI003F6E491F
MLLHAGGLLRFTWLVAVLLLRAGCLACKIIYALLRFGSLSRRGRSRLREVREPAGALPVWRTTRRRTHRRPGRPFFFALQLGRHDHLFAPMGAGKGISVVIPNLLDYRGSVVCTDIKG